MSTKSEIVLSEQYPIQVLCNFINPYNGSRETLTAFLTNCQDALDLASDSQKRLLLKFIISKLEGKARIACSNKIFDNFESLREFLRQNFGETKHYSHLFFDLQSCKQRAGESVSEFSLRIDTCLTEMQTEIHNSNTSKKDLSGRIAMTEDLTIHSFMFGLTPRIGNMVRCRNPKNLNEAINIAIEEEKIQNFVAKSHSTHHQQPKLSSQASSFNSTKIDTKQKIPPQIVCSYCKNPGHHIAKCKKREYNNNLRNNSYNKYRPLNHIPPDSESSPFKCCEIEKTDSNLN